MPAPPPTKLDPQQVLQHSFDDDTGSLRTTVTATITPTGSLSIAVTSSEDSISLGSSDGSLTATYTQVGPDTGLDTYVINPLAISSIPPISITGTSSVSGNALTATIANFPATQGVSGTVSAFITNPVSATISGTSTVSVVNPINYGAAASAVRTASQIGNATGAADFNTGNASAQTLRTVIATNQPAVTIRPSTGTLTDFSGNASTTSTQFVPANANRKYLLIFNQSSTNIFINFTSPATNGAGSFQLGGRSMFIMEGTWVSTEAVNIISNSGTPAVTVKEGV